MKKAFSISCAKENVCSLLDTQHREWFLFVEKSKFYFRLAHMCNGGYKFFPLKKEGGEMKAHKRKQFKLDILITNMCTYLMPLIFIVILHSSLYRNRQYALSEISTERKTRCILNSI